MNPNRPKDSIWLKFIAYCNSCHRDKIPAKRCNYIKLGDKSYCCYARFASTLDTYRRTLQLCGYLREIEPGVYAVVKQIPPALTIKEAKRLAYPPLP